MKYRKKPVVVDAVQWWKHGDHPAVIPTGNERIRHCGRCLSCLPHGLINTHEGLLLVCPGDWIVTDVKGKHYPCKPNVFEATYDAMVEGDPLERLRELRGKMCTYGNVDFLECSYVKERLCALEAKS